MSSVLEVLFSSSARVQVLGLFLTNPDRQFYQRETERELGQPIRAVQREVERLEGIGLLQRSSEGNRVFYRLNPGFPLLAELTALFERALGAETVSKPQRRTGSVPPEPWGRPQPFAWMETPAQPPLPAELRVSQISGEWDQAY